MAASMLHTDMKLYEYDVATCAYRVRIALEMKSLEVEHVTIDLDQGREIPPEYARMNPQGLVPTLVDGETVLTQSLAIIEYLEEKYPQPALLPDDPVARARVRAMALIMDCEAQPLINLRVRNFLDKDLRLPPRTRAHWFAHWSHLAFQSYETMLRTNGPDARFSFGNSPSLADIFLIPQVFLVSRLGVSLEKYPAVLRTYRACMELPAFRRAAPQSIDSPFVSGTPLI